MGGLGAPLADLPGVVQDLVHGADAAQVAALIQQHRPRLGRGLVSEPLAERGRVGRPRCGRPFLFRRRLRVPLPVQCRPGFPQQLAGPFHRGERFQLSERGVNYRCRFASESALAE